jgi:hypothetical protein
MPFEPDATIVRTSETLATEVDGEIVLISIRDGRYFGLDQVGSEIWRRLEAPKRVDALCAELKDHFDGDPETIERETLAFLDTLSGSNLVVPA